MSNGFTQEDLNFFLAQQRAQQEQDPYAQDVGGMPGDPGFVQGPSEMGQEPGLGVPQLQPPAIPDPNQDRPTRVVEGPPQLHTNTEEAMGREVRQGDPETADFAFGDAATLPAQPSLEDIQARTGEPVPQAQPTQTPETETARRQEVVDTQRKQEEQADTNQKAVGLGKIVTTNTDGFLGAAIASLYKMRAEEITQTKDKYIAAAEQEYKAGKRGADIKGKGADAVAKQNALYAAQLKADAKQTAADLENVGTEVSNLYGQVSKGVINPGRAFESPGSWKRVSLGIAAAFQGALMAAQGRSGPNPVIQHMQAMVEQDVQAQQAEMNKNFRLLGLKRGEQKNLQAKLMGEKSLGRALRFAAIKSKMEADLASSALPAHLKAKLMEDIAKFDAMAKEELKGFYDIAAKTAIAGYDQRSKMALVAQKALSKGGSVTTAAAEKDFVPGDPLALVSDFPNRYIKAGARGIDLSEFKKRATSRLNFVDGMNEYALKVRRFNLAIAKTRAGSPEWLDLMAVAGKLVNEGRKLTSSGANFTEQEMELIRQQFGLVEQGLLKGAPVNMQLFSNAVGRLAQEQIREYQTGLGLKADSKEMKAISAGIHKQLSLVKSRAVDDSGDLSPSATSRALTRSAEDILKDPEATDKEKKEARERLSDSLAIDVAEVDKKADPSVQGTAANKALAKYTKHKKLMSTEDRRKADHLAKVKQFAGNKLEAKAYEAEQKIKQAEKELKSYKGQFGAGAQIGRTKARIIKLKKQVAKIDKTLKSWDHKRSPARSGAEVGEPPKEKHLIPKVAREAAKESAVFSKEANEARDKRITNKE